MHAEGFNDLPLQDYLIYKDSPLKPWYVVSDTWNNNLKFTIVWSNFPVPCNLSKIKASFSTGHHGAMTCEHLCPQFLAPKHKTKASREIGFVPKTFNGSAPQFHMVISRVKIYFRSSNNYTTTKFISWQPKQSTSTITIAWQADSIITEFYKTVLPDAEPRNWIESNIVILPVVWRSSTLPGNTNNDIAIIIKKDHGSVQSTNCHS